MSNKFKREFDNFEATPNKGAWKAIKKNLPKPKFNWLAFSTITGAALLITGAVILILSPINSNKLDNNINAVSNNNKVIETKTNPIHNTIAQNKIDDSKIITNDNNSQKSVISQESSPVENTILNNDPKVEPKPIEVKESKINIIENKPIIKPQKKVIAREEPLQEKEKSPIIPTDDTNTNRLVLLVPNAFTPLEATNNIFKPAHTELKRFEMNIYNRSGVLLFSSNNIDFGWNGKYKGSECAAGAYPFLIKFETLTGVKNTQTGYINLLR
ncbi:MAG: hypothetical protein H6Q15_363 [Bacteroidetes bacterium]|nr:hypothetical protein [Bacteroidota bacterium]